MNQKLLIIIVLVVLIVLMGILTLTSKKKESFHGEDPNCNDITDLNICAGYFGNICRINPKDDTQCMHKCKFNPEVVFSTDYDGTFHKNPDNGMEEVEIDGKKSYSFIGESDNGPMKACRDRCPDAKNGCLPEDCITECRNYIEAKVKDNSKANIRYLPYPTNLISENTYQKIKDEILSKLDNKDFSQEIEDKIFKDNIDSKLTKQVDLKERTDDLIKVIEDLNDLKSTGNNFIQQIDQLGAFQDKYSDKIDSLLNEKRNSNKSLDKNIVMMSKKLEMLNNLYRDYNVAANKPDEDIKQFYKTATCLANGEKLYFTPIKYNEGTDDVPVFKYFKNGAYLINLDKAGQTNNFLFIEPLKTDSNGEKIFCNPNNLDCNYKLTIGTERDNSDLFSINVIDNIVSKPYPGRYSEENKRDFQHRKQAYFNIIEIKNNEDYNSIIIKTPDGSNNLVTSVQNIKYPFYVIESIELPGYLINISTGSIGGKSITLNPADKRGTEKFTVDNIQTGVSNVGCNV